MSVKATDFASQGPQFLGWSYQELDCQGLIEAMLSKVGIRRDWRGSNHMYRDCLWTGTPEDCIRTYGKIPVGALLFIHDYGGGEKARGYTDGLGDASHVGVKLGRGDQGAIHSSKSRGGVFYSKWNDKPINGGWNMVGLLKELDYGLNAREEESMEGNAEVFSENGLPVNLRERPDRNSRALTALDVGTKVVASSASSGWTKISHNGLEGYMMSQYVRAASVQTAPVVDAAPVQPASLEARVAKLEEKVSQLCAEWESKKGWG